MKHTLKKESKVVGQQSLQLEKKGLKLRPRNMDKYNLPKVDTVVFFNQSFIKKLLEKKLARKLNYYLEYIMQLLNEDDTPGESIREALNDLSKYKDIVQYKYRKYLDDKYFQILMKKIAVLEYELNTRLVNIREYEYEEEKTSHRSR